MALKYCCVFEPVSTVQPGACLDPSATIHLRSEVLGNTWGCSNMENMTHVLTTIDRSNTVQSNTITANLNIFILSKVLNKHKTLSVCSLFMPNHHLVENKMIKKNPIYIEGVISLI